MTGAMDTAERLELSTRADWRAWLAANHKTSGGVWLVSFKARTGKPRIDYEASVEEALCFGWIDGRLRPLDDERSMQWFSPRRPKGTWARSNKERVARLEAAGLMTDAGRAVIELAKANGSWTALDDIEALVMPPDLVAALDAHPGARERWEAASVSARRMGLAWIAALKRPEGRAARVEIVAEALAGGQPLNRIVPGLQERPRNADPKS